MSKTLTQTIRDYLISSASLPCYSPDSPDIDECLSVAQGGSRTLGQGDLPLLVETVQIVSRSLEYETSLSNGMLAYLKLSEDDVVTKMSECERLILSLSPQQGPSYAGKDPTGSRYLSIFNIDVIIHKG